MLNPYAKAVILAILALATAIGTGWDDSVLTTSEIVLAVSAGVIAGFGSWVVSHPLIKTAVGAVTAGLAALAVGLEDSALSAQEWTTLIVAVVGTLAAGLSIQNTRASNAPTGPPQ